LDDGLYLTQNPLIRAADGLYRFWFTSEPVDYLPVSNTTLWIEWRLWGMNPVGYHITNLLLHIGAVLLMWNVLNRLSLPGAFVAAFLFAVHPVNVESVAWITQRKNLMALLFLLLSTRWFLNGEPLPSARFSPRVTDRWYWLSLAAFVLAMLSKGSVAIFPLLLVEIIWWMHPLTRRDLVRVAPFFLVSVVLSPVNMWFAARATVHLSRASAPFAERLLGAGGVVWFYLYKALLPVHLAFVYPQWQVRTDQLSWWLPLLTVLTAAGVLWRYRGDWSRALSLTGRSREAIEQYQQALRVRPDFAEAHFNLAIALTAANQQDAAIGNFQQALRIRPDFPEAHFNLGIALLQAGQIQEAAERDLHAQLDALPESPLQRAPVAGHLARQRGDDVGDDRGQVGTQGHRQVGRQIAPWWVRGSHLISGV